MRRARTFVATLILLSATTLVVTPPAGAVTKLDGNDTKGLFDLRSVAVEMTGDGLVATFKTYERWPNNSKLGSSYFLLAMDRDGDEDADSCAFIYYYGGLKGALTNCARKTYDSLPVSKAGRTATVTLESGAAESVHWFAGTYYKKGPDCRNGCIDTVPNRRWVFNDVEPPSTSWVTTTSNPYSSISLSTTNEIPLAFTATDDSGSIASWSIKEETGFDTYVEVASGGGDDLTPTLALEEGRYYVLKPFATDASGNEGAGFGSLLQIGVPFDEMNPLVEFSAGWTHHAGDGYYQGTYSTSSTPGATMTLTFPIDHSYAIVSLLLGPGDGTGRFDDGSGVGGHTVTETPSTPKLQRSDSFLYSAPGTYTVELTVLSGTLVVDGVLLGAN